MGKLFEELKRRKVFRVAAVYAVAAWLIIQIAETVFPALLLPDWSVTLITMLLILGFLPTLIAAWAYELTPEGVKADSGITVAQPSTSTNTDRKLIYATFGLVLLVAGIQLSDRLFSDNGTSVNRSAESAIITNNPAVMRSSIILDLSFQTLPGAGRTLLDIAPDGSFLAYAAIEEGYWALRNLATQETQILEETSRNGKAKFSPDSQKLLLVSAIPLATGVLSLQGGSFQPLPIEGTLSAAWLSDEEVIYQHADSETRILSIVDGTETIVPDLDAADSYYVFNSLPSGSAFLYRQAPSNAQLDDSTIQVYDLINQSKTLVTNDGYLPQYVNSGHVLFLRDGDLWAVPFDAANLRVSGLEKRILEGVHSQRSYFWGAYSVSGSGRLVYLPGSEGVFEDQTTLYWTDRLGNREEIPLRTGIYQEPRISPNGELLALTSFQPDGASDIWIHNFSNGAFNPVTFSGNARTPLWTPDGSQLVYQLNTLNRRAAPRGELWIKNANGTGQAERILDVPAKPDSFSPIDDKLIYFIGGGGNGVTNLSTLTNSDDAWISDPLFHTERATWGARVSPDGRWIAYGSAESGRMQIYVQPYPNLDGGRWQVSSDTIGTREPSWGPNGDELFYLRNDGSLMRSEVTIDGDSLSASVPQPLFADMPTVGSSPLYAVSNDGERFLHLSPLVDEQNTGIDQDHTELVVISSFFEELRRLAPPDP